MDNALLISHLVLWVVVLAMGVAIVALVRQIGVLHERVAPAGALMMGQGPKVGELAPVLDVEDFSGKQLRIGGEADDGRSTLVFFLSPTCPVCKSLLPVLNAMRRSERAWLRVVLASDGEREPQEAFVAKYKLDAFTVVLSTELGLTYQVAKLPYGLLIDENGVLSARGLVNSREHLESLFEAKVRGVASIQEYAEQQRKRQGAA